MANVMFKHENGDEAQCNITGFKGVIDARADHLYGCNRYHLQPKATKEGTIPDGAWFDEDGITITKKAKVKGHEPEKGKERGGFIGRDK
ncbi:gp35 [Alphaproteobacteria phage PhiJL001]|uniref:Gp35 n=1 Tax=Alphaproteobacteria phage PhiJL001 TaxID=2681607 RepID=Q5DN70_9CAUD|nr:gp35 [Alphaproteobacteria phage PhiJL001]AAT69511.1 gp35 [Alphaproteobacteria phage PhiJL001]